MPYTIVQKNSGVTQGNGSASLANGTVAGNVTVLVLSANATITLPTGFTLLGPSPIGVASLGIYAKPSVDAETSWAFTTSATLFEWAAFEVSGLDWDVLIDTVPTADKTSTTTAISTFGSGTNPPSTVYDGMVIAAYGGQIATPVAPSWSGYDSNVVEEVDISQVSATLGHGLAVAIGGALQPATWNVAATCSTTPQQQTGTHVVLTCLGSKVASDLILVDSAEQGTIAFTPAVPYNPGIFAAVPTNVSCLTAAARSGSYGYRLSSVSAAANYNPAPSLSFTKRPALQRSFRFATLPTFDVELWILTATAGPIVTVRYLGATNPGHIGLKIGTGTEQVSDNVITANQWFTLDIRPDSRATTYKCDWSIDYNSELTDTVPTVLQTTASLAGQTAGGNWSSTHRVGWTNAVTLDMDTDDGYGSNSPNAFPMGDLRGLLVPIDGAATPIVTGTVGNFALITSNATGTTLTTGTTTTARDNIREGPPPTIGATQNGVCQITAAGTDYLDFPFADVSLASQGYSPRAFQILVCGWAAAATAGTIFVAGYDAQSSVEYPLASSVDTDYNFDNSTTAPVWLQAALHTSQGVRVSWTETKINGMRFRMGKSLDATPDQGVLWAGGVVVVRADPLV